LEKGIDSPSPAAYFKNDHTLYNTKKFMNLSDEVKIQLLMSKSNHKDLGFSTKIRAKISKKLLRNTKMSDTYMKLVEN
jgi:hypothetical protein